MTVKKTIVNSLILAMLTLTMGCSHLNAEPVEYQASDELVVLAHGLGRSDWAMWRLAQRFENANYKVCRLDYSTLGVSVAEVLAETSKQIDRCIVNAPKVHFVGHSLGGLVIRAYLQNNQVKLDQDRTGQVVLMGTPNKGSELADYYNDSWLMKVAGGISRALVTGTKSLGNNLDELDVNLGVIAGTKPLLLTSKKFTGPNDGLVSVESTKLNFMSDFIAIDVGHSQMRYNLEVAEQTIHFLRKGEFKHE
ncbi:alpha/beta fold hydrolase [Paraglaciecola sp. 2405UD69-4]|uniref:alpha/beta fold hydrolase n=1 Tax=Paraglaciecola sp. 2405UD69-4 TaxID=3391836 RepID=UPI0039C97EF7